MKPCRVFFFFNLNFYKIYFSGAVLGLGCCTGFSPGAALQLRCAGFACSGAQVLEHVGSVLQFLALGVSAAVVVHRLPCSMACGYLPRPGIEPVSCTGRWILYHLSHQRNSETFSQMCGYWDFPVRAQVQSLVGELRSLSHGAA